MAKEFNVTGACKPDLHYMVNIDGKIDEMTNLIEKGNYFTINRPRQYGKSTCLEMVEKKLISKGYMVLSTTFENMSAIDFQDVRNFSREFTRQLKRILKRNNQHALLEIFAEAGVIETFGQMDDLITELIEGIEEPTVLLVDEVDKSSDNQLFLDFLSLLRSKYLARDKYATFKSVVLAGVYDVKTLKLKLLPNDERKYNSPWNIATDFTIDLSFNAEEIATMLTEYSKIQNTPIDIQPLSERLHYYTSGHPFLVSKLCKIVDEKILPEREKKNWQEEDIESAFVRLVKENYSTSNFDDINKNLENNTELYNLVFKIIMEGEPVSFNIGNPVIQLGALSGILADSPEGAVIHNRVYQQRILNYMASKIEISTLMEGYNFRDSFINKDNTLDIKKILLKFQEFMKMQYTEKDEEFLDKDGRLVFLAFLKPIINGKGFDFKEVQVSEEKRLDLVITYLNSQYIVELKKWYGESYHKKGIKQLCGYLESLGRKKGYLVIFDFRSRKKNWKQELIQKDDKEVFAVWV